MHLYVYINRKHKIWDFCGAYVYKYLYMWLQTDWPWIIFDGWHFCAFSARTRLELTVVRTFKRSSFKWTLYLSLFSVSLSLSFPHFASFSFFLFVCVQSISNGLFFSLWRYIWPSFWGRFLITRSLPISLYVVFFRNSALLAVISSTWWIYWIQKWAYSRF